MGKASNYLEVVWEKSREQDLTIDKVLGDYDTRFGYKDIPETAQLRFDTAPLEVGESNADFSDRCLILASKAFRNLPDYYMIEQASSIFCQGSIDKEAGSPVATLRPKTMDAAQDSLRIFQYTHRDVSLWYTQQNRHGKHKPRGEEVQSCVNAVTTNSFNPTNSKNAIEHMSSKMDKLEKELSLIGTKLELRMV